MQEKKIWVLELVPMDLLDKVEEIAMTNLSILYNTNPVPLVIFIPTTAANLEQQRLTTEEEQQEVDTFVLARRKKNKRKVVYKVVIREVSTIVGSGNLLLLRILNFVRLEKGE